MWEKPFERFQMNILGILFSTFLENIYLLVIIDCFTKWVETFSLKKYKSNYSSGNFC